MIYYFNKFVFVIWALYITILGILAIIFIIKNNIAYCTDPSFISGILENILDYFHKMGEKIHAVFSGGSNSSPEQPTQNTPGGENTPPETSKPLSVKKARHIMIDKPYTGRAPEAENISGSNHPIVENNVEGKKVRFQNPISTTFYFSDSESQNSTNTKLTQEDFDKAVDKWIKHHRLGLGYALESTLEGREREGEYYNFGWIKHFLHLGPMEPIPPSTIPNLPDPAPWLDYPVAIPAVVPAPVPAPVVVPAPVPAVVPAPVPAGEPFGKYSDFITNFFENKSFRNTFLNDEKISVEERQNWADEYATYEKHIQERNAALERYQKTAANLKLKLESGDEEALEFLDSFFYDANYREAYLSKKSPAERIYWEAEYKSSLNNPMERSEYNAALKNATKRSINN